MGNIRSQVIEEIQSVPTKVPIAWKRRRPIGKIGGGPAIGIDLGTTNCCVAVWRNGGVEIIRNEEGGTIVPSCVAFPPSGGCLVGGIARDQALENVANTLFHVKRWLGRKYDDVSRSASMCLWPYRFARGPDSDGGDGDECVIEVDQEGGVKLRLTPEKVSSLILMKLREMAEECLGCPVSNAVIAVPANFSQSQKQATKRAAILAGLNVTRLMTESSAAAFTYALRTNNVASLSPADPLMRTLNRRWIGISTDSLSDAGSNCCRHVFDGRSDGQSQKTLMVVDWGGGTFDVSILRVSGMEFRVIATAGDCQLGGQDIDDAMVTHFAREISRKHKLSITDNARALRRLRMKCEKLKHKLSSSESYSLIADGLCNGHDFTMQMTRSQLEEMCRPIFQRCIDLVRRALEDAEVSKSEIGKLILAGGSMRIPKIQRMLSDLFGGKQLCKVIHPDECIAYGAAVQAALLTGEASLNVLDLEVVETVPVSIGFSDVRGNFVRLIKRNTPFPARVIEPNCRTPFDGRTMGTVSVYEGERVKCDENVFLGDVVLDGLRPGPPGSGNEKVPLEIMFEIDDDGILTATLSDKLTGRYACRSFGRRWGRCTDSEGRTAAKIASNVEDEDAADLTKSTARWRLTEYVHRLRWRLSFVTERATRSRMMKILDAEERWLSDNERKLFDVCEYHSHDETEGAHFRLSALEEECFGALLDDSLMLLAMSSRSLVGMGLSEELEVKWGKGGGGRVGRGKVGD
ncbi:hypothetical protein CBR_g28688 [Chara braunii]|uniref:Uncharacterized protein n=1 Tax=Chara braunii TaxID=69332 RepID=A0A388L9L3_CHABU|nr:hypothetical protein CBR_g28688 [Chara braunii]|eukprot:GBG78974.1 hypothetical protein CBR_g28688 [Chara braunii]